MSEPQSSEQNEGNSPMAIMDIAAALFMAALYVCVLLQVVDRYFAHLSVVWSEELARFLLLAVACVGFLQAYKSGSHFKMNILSIMLGRGAAVWLRGSVKVATAAFMVLFGISGLQFCRAVADTVGATLGVSLAVPTLILPICSFGAAFILLRGVFSVGPDGVE